MPWIKTPNGPVHVRMSGRRRNLCSCGRFATLQCDWPTENRSSGTCDKPVCTTCARHVGENKDYCPFHRGDPPMTEAEGIAAGEAEAQKLADMFGIKR